MEQRGRKSAASLSVVQASFDGRPRAPSDLTDFQKEVWDRTVAGEAKDVFRTPAVQQVLKEYCRHVETAHLLTNVIDRAMASAADAPDLDRLEKLLRCRERETKALADKATKLRLTNQSRYTPHAAGTRAKNTAAERKPWQNVG